MSTTTYPKYLTRGTSIVGTQSGGDEQQPQVAPTGELIVAQGLPSKTELVRLGGSWAARNTTGQAPLTAVPTTTAGFSLYNGESGQSAPKAYVVDRIVALEGVLDATQQNQLSVWFMLNSPTVAAPVAVAGLVQSLSGKQNGSALTAPTTRARIATGLTVTNEGWFPIGGSSPNAAAVAGGLWRTTDIPIDGLIIIPPGGMLSLQAVKVAATAAQMFFAIYWHEAAITLA